MSDIKPLTESEALVLFGWARVEDFMNDLRERGLLAPPVDPLLGIVEEAIAGTAEKGALQLREALAKRGLKIVETDDADR